MGMITCVDVEGQMKTGVAACACLEGSDGPQPCCRPARILASTGWCKEESWFMTGLSLESPAKPLTKGLVKRESTV